MGKKDKGRVVKKIPVVAKSTVQETVIGSVRSGSGFLTPALIDFFIQQFSSDNVMLPLDEKRKQEAADFLTTHHLIASKVKKDLLDIACSKLLFPAIAALLPDPFDLYASDPVVITDLLPASRLLLVACIECYNISPYFKAANLINLEQVIQEIPPTTLKNLLLVQVTAEQKLVEFLSSKQNYQALIPVIMSLIKAYGFEKDANIVAILPLLALPALPAPEASAVNTLTLPPVILFEGDAKKFLNLFDQAPNKIDFLFKPDDEGIIAWNEFLHQECIQHLLYFLRNMPRLKKGQRPNTIEQALVKSVFQPSVAFALGANNRFLAVSMISWFYNMLGESQEALFFVDDQVGDDSLLFISVLHECLSTPDLPNPIRSKVEKFVQYIGPPHNKEKEISHAKKLQWWAIFCHYKFIEVEKLMFTALGDTPDPIKLFDEAVRLNCIVTVAALLDKFRKTIVAKGGVLAALDLTALSSPFFWGLARVLILKQAHAKLTADVISYHFDCLLQACSPHDMINHADLEPYKTVLDFDPLYVDLYHAAVVRNWSSVAYLNRALQFENLELAVIILNSQRVKISDEIHLNPEVCVKLFMHLPEYYHQKPRFFRFAFNSAHKTPLLPALQEIIIDILKKQAHTAKEPMTQSQQADLLKFAALINSKELVEFFMSGQVVEDVLPDAASVNDQSRFSCHALAMICDHPSPDRNLVASLVPSVHELHKITVDVVSELSPLCEWVKKNKEQFTPEIMRQLSKRSYLNLSMLFATVGDIEYDLRALFGYITALFYLRNRFQESGITNANIDPALASMTCVITEKKNEFFPVLVMSGDPFLISQVLAYAIDIQKNNDGFVLPCAIDDIVGFAAVAFDPVNAAYRQNLILVLLAIFRKDFVAIIERHYLHKLEEFSADTLLAVIVDTEADSPILSKLRDIVPIIATPDYVRLLIDELRKKYYSFKQILDFTKPGDNAYQVLITHMVLHYAKESKAAFKDHIANVLRYASDSSFDLVLAQIAHWGVSKQQLSALTIWDSLSESKLQAMERHDLFKNLQPIQERIDSAKKERLTQERLEAERKRQVAETKRIAEEKIRAEKEHREHERREAEQKRVQQAVSKQTVSSTTQEIKQVSRGRERDGRPIFGAYTVLTKQSQPVQRGASYSSVAATEQTTPSPQSVTMANDRQWLLAEQHAELGKRQAKLEEQEKALRQREIAMTQAAEAQAKKDKEQRELIAAKDQLIAALQQQVAVIPEHVAKASGLEAETTRLQTKIAELEAELVQLRAEIKKLNGATVRCQQLEALQQESIRVMGHLQEQLAAMIADKVARDHIIARYESVVHAASAVTIFSPPNNYSGQRVVPAPASRTPSTSSISPKSS